MILNKKAFSLDGNQLKTLAVVFMIFDHIYSYLLLDILPNWCSLIARFVAPLFVFMLIVFHDPSIAYTAHKSHCQ
ncbi:TraX family protein [Lactobacillus crispatus]|uniref:TraX family protein n=1 Tax=Lactobacillus crispatus TaxID=47770 RepID=UPI003F2685F9